jgi:serine phosphatase RsbU (regulator of sigma subunit)
VDLLTLPLRGRGSTYGALTVARRAGDGFDEAGVAFLAEVAERAAQGLDTQRALAESRRVAAVLSRDLVPQRLPDLPGVELAAYHRVAIEQEALGGDFYDVHGGPEDWTAVLGDVCGKGVEAAALTGRVRQSVRTAALVDRSPARVLDLVNHVLLADADDTFVTALCARGRRDGDTLLVDVAGAGHPQPWLIRRDGSVQPAPAEGVVLGLLDEPGYEEHTLRLEPGDTLLMYTDGVLEAPGRRDRFGEDRLREVLAATGAASASAIVEAVAVALSTHLGDRGHDDIAIVAVQAAP